MEAERYRRICRLIDQLAPHGRRARQQFADAVIVKVFFWSTHCDRPMRWACDADNWPEPLRLTTAGATLPSQPTMSRRLRTIGVLQLIERVQARLADVLVEQQAVNDVVKAIDSKPLKVGSYSKDRDARRGRAAGEMARGYKLHALTVGRAFVHWTLTGMNANDQVGAAMLLPMLGARGSSSSSDSGWGYVSADNGYDANPVYAEAQAVNHQLIAPPRRTNTHVRDVRRNRSERIRSLDLCADPLQYCGTPSAFAAAIIDEREEIERNFGHAAMNGLFAPPPWIRTPHRTAAWTAAKLIQTMMRRVQIAGLTL